MSIKLNTSGLDRIANLIKANSHHPIVIKIDGRGGSGKSTFANRLAELLEEACVVNLDAHVVNGIDLFSAETIRKNFEVDFQDTSYDELALMDILNNKKFKYYIFEGCFSFKNTEFIKADYNIWVDISKDEAADRLNQREKNDSSHSHFPVELIALSTKKWQESEDMYIKNYNPIEKADFIVSSR